MARVVAAFRPDESDRQEPGRRKEINAKLITDRPSAGDIVQLVRRISAFNVERSGVDDARCSNLLLHTATGDLKACLHGHPRRGYCEMKRLWVSDERRGGSPGTALFDAAEHEARDRRCDRVILASYSFLAS